MSRALLLGALLVAAGAHAAETTTLPKGAWAFDVSYIASNLANRWGDDQSRLPLLDDIRRYEPGAGLQGILQPRPVVAFQLAVLQLQYGLTDWLTVGATVPIALRTAVDTNIGWQSGDYQSALGRAYSLDDFWAWAASMGQQRVPDRWAGNQGVLADIVLSGRFLIPELRWLKAAGLRVATTLQVALPTGRQAPPEELVTAGTSTWELHAYGDVETHLQIDRPFFQDGYGIPRLSLGADLWFSYFRPRVVTSPLGTENPLLQTFQPYIGDTYVIDPGEWLAASVSMDVVPIIGPARASIVSGGDLERARALPPLLTLNVGYAHIGTFQTTFKSNSDLWSYERERYWLPGEKNQLRAGLTLSFLRLGVPVQVYANYRNQDLIPGRNTRAANTLTAGARLLFKFW